MTWADQDTTVDSPTLGLRPVANALQQGDGASGYATAARISGIREKGFRPGRASGARTHDLTDYECPSSPDRSRRPGVPPVTQGENVAAEAPTAGVHGQFHGQGSPPWTIADQPTRTNRRLDLSRRSSPSDHRSGRSSTGQTRQSRLDLLPTSSPDLSKTSTTLAGLTHLPTTISVTDNGGARPKSQNFHPFR